MDPTERQESLRHFADELGLLFEQSGAAPMMGRILGWLMVCDPRHQSSAQLAQALGASKASISTGTRQLMGMGLVERVPVRGQRGSFFAMRDDSWGEYLARDLARVHIFRELADRGLALLADAPASRRRRLHELRTVYAFFEAELPALIARLDAHLAQNRPPEEPA